MIGKKRDKFTLTLFMLCLFLEIHSLQSGEAVTIGKFECLTTVLMERAYDDNVLLTKYDQEGSSVSTISPTISLKGKGSRVDVDASYNAHLKLYKGYPSQNQYYQAGTGNIGIKPTEKMHIGIKGQNTYSFVTCDEREPSLTENTVKYNDFSITPSVEQEIGRRLNAELSYTYTERVYQQEDEDLEGRKSYSGAVDLHFKLKNNVSLDGGYGYTITDFAAKTPDFTERRADSGFTWHIKSKIRIIARYGQIWKVTELGRMDSYPAINSTIDLHLGKKTLLTAMYKQSSAYTSSHDTRNDSFLSRDASVNIRHDVLSRKVTIRYGGTYNLSDYDSGDRKDRFCQKIASIDWRISERISLTLTGSSLRSQYTYIETDGLADNRAMRRDNSYRGGGEMRLKITKLLNLVLSGNYTTLRYNPDNHQAELFDGSSTIQYSFTKSTFFEAGYQRMKRRSASQDLSSSGEEDRSAYLRNKYRVGLRATF